MNYTAKDHAFLYGVIAQTALKLYPGCTDAVVSGIKEYGMQRGSRMAQTARAFGDEATMQNYLAYGEWAAGPGEMDVHIVQSSPLSVWNVRRCPWSEEWKERGMLDVGKLYCAYVDTALVKGFNPELVLGIGPTQTAGDSFCLFEWNGADMTPEAAAENKRRQERAGTARLRPWLYHMAHIYKTMGGHLGKTLGEGARAAVYAEADRIAASRYGEDCVAALHAGLLVDYWVSPSCLPSGSLPDLFRFS